MGRRFITARDIDDVLAAGGSELTIGPDDRLTDLARDHARERGVAIVSGPATAGAVAGRPSAAGAGAGRPSAAAQQTSPPSPAGSTSSGSPATSAGGAGEGPTRRQLRAAVRAAVVEEFGTTPAGVDAAIGRVFDRFGVED